MIITRWAAAALFVLAVPVFLVLTNVRVATLAPGVYRYSFRQYDVARASGIDLAELDRAAEDITTYFHDGREFLDTSVVVNGQEQPLFSPREVLHMRDVKQLFRWVFDIHEAALAYIVVYIGAVVLWSGEQSLRRLGRLAMLAGGFTAALLTVGALATLVGFDQLFLQFHMLSFANDFWQLDPARDHLIQMFPQGFWFDVTLAVVVLSIMEGGVIALAGYGYLGWSERRQASRRVAFTVEPE